MDLLARPVDGSGDILPVRSASDLLTGNEAAAAGLRDHLKLFRGDWWEYAEKGNEIFELMAIARGTSQDAATLQSWLTAYILTFPGIVSVTDIRSSFTGHAFSYSCTAHTEQGDLASVAITY
ncbi:MAG: hypothetical protein K5922_05000 [Clostridiales bacterium]|nr:hypothetical protein [Clostridiales bacterium]